MQTMGQLPTKDLETPIKVREPISYKEDTAHTKLLKLIKVYGNSNFRYVEFEDEAGVTLTWLTAEGRKAYWDVVNLATYKFKVMYIINSDIMIGYVKLIKKEGN